MPDAVTDLLGNAGPLHALMWDGKGYPVAAPCLNTVKRSELFVVRHSIDALEEMRAALTADEYAARKSSLDEALDGREFAAGGRLWNAVIKRSGGLFGVAVSLWACVMEGCEMATPKVPCPLTPADVLTGIVGGDPEVSAAATLVVPGFFEHAGRRAGRPPAEAERLKAALMEAVAKAAG